MPDEIEQTIAPIDANDPVPHLARSITIELPDQGDRKINTSMALVLACHILGLSGPDIAKRTGLTHGTVRNSLSHGRRLGARKEIDPTAIVKDRLFGKAVDTLDELMDEGHSDELRAKIATDAVKGVGGYQQYAKQEMKGGPAGAGGGFDFTLNLVITEPKRAMKDGDVIAGEIVGVARTLDAADDAKDK